VTTLPKHAQAAALVRAQITDGTLMPGQPAPSGAHLARLTGYSPLTCRRALRSLVADGTLTPGPSRNARPRVAAPGTRHAGDTAGTLSRALAALRRAAGMTQPELAACAGYSVTTVGHAETGRLWQARAFWEKADLILAAGGELTRRYDAHRAATAAPDQPCTQPRTPGPPALSRVTFHWTDGTESTFCPPALPSGAVNATV
jgi:hypothetical protein